MSYVIYGILIYLALVFIFRVVVPVYLASRKFKQGFKEMKERMEQQMNQTQQNMEQPSQQKQTPPKSDYIEFEEIK